MTAPNAPAGSAAREGRLVSAALRCYPARWQRRHADEAAELAVLLIRDGRPAASIAWSYLTGAVREWLTPRPGRSLSTVAAALLGAACLLGFSAALVAETVPARAAGTIQSPRGPLPAEVKAAPTSTGSPHHFTSCPTVPPGQVASAVPAASRAQPSIRRTAHAHSC
jgi:hypothetical protein